MEKKINCGCSTSKHKSEAYPSIKANSKPSKIMQYKYHFHEGNLQHVNSPVAELTGFIDDYFSSKGKVS